MPDLSAPAGASDFYFVPAEDPETAVQHIVELVKIRIPRRFGLNPIRDSQPIAKTSIDRRVGGSKLPQG
jgi:exodeoxyribonuclease V alpha subunit